MELSSSSRSNKSLLLRLRDTLNYMVSGSKYLPDPEEDEEALDLDLKF